MRLRGLSWSHGAATSTCLDPFCPPTGECPRTLLPCPALAPSIPPSVSVDLPLLDLSREWSRKSVVVSVWPLTRRPGQFHAVARGGGVRGLHLFPGKDSPSCGRTTSLSTPPSMTRGLCPPGGYRERGAVRAVCIAQGRPAAESRAARLSPAPGPPPPHSTPRPGWCQGCKSHVRGHVVGKRLFPSTLFVFFASGTRTGPFKWIKKAREFNVLQEYNCIFIAHYISS